MGNRIARPVRPPVPRPSPDVRRVLPDHHPSPAVQNATNTSSSRSPPRVGRERLNRLWTHLNEVDNEPIPNKLARAGFYQTTRAGIIQLLPLGLRLQDKIASIVDRHMRELGASRLQLSALTPESLWHQSGRLDQIGSELFRLQDRKGTQLLLSPTHEEAITTLVSDFVKTGAELPLRLYQITQKYRDELRPRSGLLRSRDFLMKDLYTFDHDVKSALKTYDEVRAAYAKIFIDELKLPILTAEASSGDMGGSLSHEYHLPSTAGEDLVISCTKCDYVANEEVAEARPSTRNLKKGAFFVWRGISKDRMTIVNVWYGRASDKQDEVILKAPLSAINTYAVKRFFPELDSGVSDPYSIWSDQASKTASSNINVVNLFDVTIPEEAKPRILASKNVLPEDMARSPTSTSNDFFLSAEIKDKSDHMTPTNYRRIGNSETCPRCEKHPLKVTKAIEIGHTFHLGTRYSEPLGALVRAPNSIKAKKTKTPNTPPEAQAKGKEETDGTTAAAESTATDEPPDVGHRAKTAMQMGCHGIGISRMIGAVAQHVATPTSFNWPRAIVPYEVVITASDPSAIPDANAVLKSLYDQAADRNIDVVLDDQPGGQMKQRYMAYQLIGIPICVVVGKEWASRGNKTVALRCNRLKFNQVVPVKQLWEHVKELLDKL